MEPAPRRAGSSASCAATEDVAASWDARANRASDVNWPERLNSERAIKDWNVNNTRIRRAARQRPEQAIVVEYTSFFSDGGGGQACARCWSGSASTYAPEVAAAFAAAHELYLDRIAGKERVLSPEAQELVDANVSPDLWKHLLKLAV